MSRDIMIATDGSEGNEKRLCSRFASDDGSSLFKASNDLMLLILSHLDIESVCHIDVAATNTTERVIWLTILSANYFVMFSEHEHCEESIRWLVKRGIRLKSLKVRYRAGETEIINVSTILGLDISSLRYINLKGTSIEDEGVLLIADG